MKASNYFKDFSKDFFMACGFLTTITAALLGYYSTETINASVLCKIIIAALAYTFFKYAFVNKYELGKKAQLISFFVCHTLADIMLLLWLWLYSPNNKIINTELLIACIVVILIINPLICGMMYIDGHAKAKQLNEKLSLYKNSSTE